MIRHVSIVIPYKILRNSCIQYWMQLRPEGEFKGLREFPGGKLEQNESAMNCAIRETFEETGVKLTESQLNHYSNKSIKLPNKIINMSIFLTSQIELFPEDGLVDLKSEIQMEQQLETLPANYEIISEIQSYLLESFGLTNKTTI